MQSNAVSTGKIEGGLRVTGEFKKRSEPGCPLVSVITVCLNNEQHLENDIRSMPDHACDNIEYIIVDGDSRDGTRQASFPGAKHILQGFLVVHVGDGEDPVHGLQHGVRFRYQHRVFPDHRDYQCIHRKFQLREGLSQRL